MAARILTRQQLYDRVWTTPIYTLARELGLSDRGLGKLCSRHSIPVPPRGWWAKNAHGKRVKQAALPPAERDYKIYFHGTSERSTAAEQPPSDEHPLVACEQQSANYIKVPELAKSALESADVDSFIQADDAGGTRPHLGINQVRLVVRSEDVEKAHAVLSDSH